MQKLHDFLSSIQKIKKDYLYSNGEKYSHKIYHPSISLVLCFVNLKNELLSFLGWPYYMLERLTIVYAMFNFFGFLFSLLKGIYNTCAIHTQVNKQASVARILFAGLFGVGIFSISIKKILLDAQINDYNKKLSSTPNDMIIHKTIKIQHLVHHNYTIYTKNFNTLFYSDNVESIVHNRKFLSLAFFPCFGSIWLTFFIEQIRVLQYHTSFYSFSCFDRRYSLSVFLISFLRPMIGIKSHVAVFYYTSKACFIV